MVAEGGAPVDPSSKYRTFSSVEPYSVSSLVKMS